jgi:pyruvate dehydrogenase E2 component (dihydrolipoamide acetyltransferase)
MVWPLQGTSEVAVGKPVLVLASSQGDVAAFANYKAGDAAAPAATPPPAAPAAAAAPAGKPASSYPAHNLLAMPALSPTMTQGNIASFKVKVGDRIAPGDVICDIETDKATMGWESQEDGFVAAVLLQDGAPDVAVGSPVGVLVDDKADVPAFADYVPPAAGGAAPAAAPAAPAAAPAPAAAKTAPTAPAPAPVARPAGQRVFASPLARAMAREAVRSPRNADPPQTAPRRRAAALRPAGGLGCRLTRARARARAR